METYDYTFGYINAGFELFWSCNLKVFLRAVPAQDIADNSTIGNTTHGIAIRMHLTPWRDLYLLFVTGVDEYGLKLVVPDEVSKTRWGHQHR